MTLSSYAPSLSVLFFRAFALGADTCFCSPTILVRERPMCDCGERRCLALPIAASATVRDRRIEILADHDHLFTPPTFYRGRVRVA